MRFLYIEVRQGHYDDDAPSFRHLVVRATDEEDAYVLGARLCEATPRPGRTGMLLNDYVVNLAELEVQ